MMQQNVELLAKRMAQLERSNRLMKIAGGIAIAVLLCAAATPHPAVNTTHLNLVNGSGQVLASLGANQNGGASLIFFDSSGHQVTLVGMGPTSSTAGLAVFDGNALLPGNNVMRGQWGISNPSQPAEIFNDANGTTRALMAASGADGGWGLSFYDPNSKKLAQVGEQNDGFQIGLETFDGNTYVPGNGVTRAYFGESNPNADIPGIGIGIRGPSQQPRVEIGESRDGLGLAAVAVYDATGTVRNAIDFDPVGNFNGLFVNDATGASASGLGQLSNGFNGLFANDLNTGNNRLAAGVDTTNSNTFVAVKDPSGNDRVLDFQVGAGEGVLVQDSNGNVVAHLP